MNRLEPIRIPISPGELLDKITILELKKIHIIDAAKLSNIELELDLLNKVKSQHIEDCQLMDGLTNELRSINGELWKIEDELRICEKKQDFGPKFIALARSVYQYNDQRAGVKRRINLHLNSSVTEEKQYVDYRTVQGG